MVVRKRSLLLCLLLLFALMGVPFARPSFSAQGPVSPAKDVAAAEESKTSHRLIVELDSAPVAVWARESVRVAPLQDGGEPLSSPAAQAYAVRLQQEQTAFVQAMRRTVPSASVSQFVNETGALEPASYKLVFNGMSVDPGAANRDQVRRQLLALPGVKHVYLDYAHYTTLYTSTQLINAPVLWNQVGGQANGGAGIKVASIDGGVHKDAPMFSGVGYSYPEGYPPNGLGLTANNNGKIIASRAYFRSWDPPAPGDENPWPGVNGTSHGVHTTGIAAGNVVTATYGTLTFPNMSGVAPRSWVMSYRVFYESVDSDASFYNAEGIAAIEDAVADGADVINNSWGGGPGSLGGEFDALDTALRNASAAGVFVTMSAGNAGPGGATGDHPSADYINVGATTSGGTIASGRLDVSGPAPVPAALQQIAYASASFGESVPFGELRSYPFVAAANTDPANEQGCNAWPANTFTGKAVLISRGTCEFGVKVLNAEKAGADFVVVYNNAAGGEDLISMGPGVVGGDATIPSVFVGHTAGVAMVDWATTNSATATLDFSTQPFQLGNEPDQIINFSSRGPGVGNTLKPDIVAPGVNILSQGYAENATGEARHLGFGQVSGTSMAAPHVAGAAALLRQIHPTWSNAYIKSALMSTAKYLEIYNEDGSPAQPLDMGAGRLDLTKAANPGVILDPPSMGLGVVPNNAVQTMTVRLTSVASQTETYNVSTLFTGAGYTATTTLPGFSVEPASVTLPAGGTATLTVTFDGAKSQGLGENQGYIVLDGATYDAHMPAWARVTYPTQKGDVLILDNDLSGLDPAFGITPGTDYQSYYTDALKELGLTYSVWDVDAHAADASTLPPLYEMLAYDAVLLFSGDNFRQVMTDTDIDRLSEYASNGRTVIAMGQDLSSALGAASGSTSDAPFFYSSVLGATWVQDSITAENQPVVPVVAAPDAPEAFEGMRLDLAAGGDGAGNQVFIDELALNTDPDPRVPESASPLIPLLYYPSTNIQEDGIVAMARRNQPSLEVPGVSYTGRTVYAGFGLEGVNNTQGMTTKAELLGAFLGWANNVPEVSITTRTVPTSNLMIFGVDYTSPITGTEPVSFRWDFGDGTAFTGAQEIDQASHTYEVCGTYTVRVEVTDNFGNRTVTSEPVDVTACNAHVLYLPLVARQNPPTAPSP